MNTNRLALTVCQPYAAWIADGSKWVENRTWRTNWRGWLAIHAGRSREWFPVDGARLDWRQFDFGAVVAVARLVAVVHVDTIRREAQARPNCLAVGVGTSHTWRQLAEHVHTEGPFCWLLENVRPVVPVVKCSGALGLWELPDDVVTAIRGALRR